MDGGIDVAVDESGNIYVAGNAGAPDGSRDYSLVKYDSEGRLVWAAAYDGGWDDAASDLAIDSEGSAYITGGAAIDSRGIVRDCATAKYDVGGQLVWAARHSSGACNALAVDGSGSVYATGETATIKYDAGGHELWMAPFDYGAAIVVDPRGGVYVTGGFGTFITAHYTASGGETWRRDSPWTGFAQALVIDSANRVVVAGFAGDFESFGTTIVKYDVDGTEMWVGGSVGEGATSLAIDADDSTRVTSLWGEVAKHDAAGTPLWVGLPGVRASTTNKAVAVDSMGRTYVTSSLSETFGLRSSIWTASYSGASFVRGDANDDGRVDISDAVFTLGSLFLGDGDPRCDDACDSNDDGTVDISDAIATLVVLFLGNGVIPLPGMTECGVDPTDDVLACDSFEGCP
jgi:hypothetical protein